MSVAQRERAALVVALRDVGPDAPTLCAGWDARDLAAHLMVREYRVDAAPGILIPLFAGHTARVQDGVAEHTEWDDLVNKVAAGPPLYSPLKLVDSVANVAEMFIHHEDIRRAQPNWEPRNLDSDLAGKLRRTLTMMARLTLSKMPARVQLRTPDGETVLIVGRGPEVTVTGKPEELLLFSTGRLARVDYRGDPDIVQAVQAAPKGL
ncbi:TIGR03085 family metal-binding protein [Mycolicibacterium helvum]|nr:TIGR03085 family metal-binding protein [Mycolicibacterium helvum]